MTNQHSGIKQTHPQTRFPSNVSHFLRFLINYHLGALFLLTSPVCFSSNGYVTRVKRITSLLFFPVLLLIFLPGCASAPLPPKNEVMVTIELLEKVHDNNGIEVAGLTTCRNQVCHIKINKYYFDECIAHEVRHALGGTHEGAHNCN